MKIRYCWKCGKEVPYQIYENLTEAPRCSNCGALYPEKPKDEALLTIYQNEYLINRTDENLAKFFTLLKDVTFNIIKHKLKSTSAYESLEDIWDKVQWSLCKLLSYYKEKPDFKITTSFIKYISQVVLFPIYNKDEKERNKKEISLHAPKFKSSDKSNQKEIGEYLSLECDGGINSLEYKLDYDIDKIDLTEKTIDFIKTVVQSVYDYDNSDKSFKNCFYMLLLYKFFIYGLMDDCVVKKIMNDMDYDLVKKFEETKEIYKKLLIEYSEGSLVYE